MQTRLSALALAILVALICPARRAATQAPARFEELGLRGAPPTATNVNTIGFGDLDGDGKLDALAGGRYGLHVLMQRAYGQLQDETAQRLTFAAIEPTDIALQDLNGDTHVDAFVATSTGLHLFLNDGFGRLIDATTRLPALSPHIAAIAVGDVDGDGDPDVVLANGGRFAAGTPDHLYLNDGNARFVDASARLPTISANSRGVALLDVENDGDLDLVVATNGPLIAPSTGRYNQLFLNDGSGSFSNATARALPRVRDDAVAVGTGDLDGDGDMDIVFAGASDFSNRVLLNGGSGRFVDAAPPQPNAEATDVAVGDLNGDGDLDLVFSYRFPSNTRTHVFLNNGSAMFTARPGSIPFTQNPALAVELADVDGDGDLDAAIPVADGRAMRLLHNDGSARFTNTTTPFFETEFTNGRKASAADVDRDGDLDLVIAGTSQSWNALPGAWLFKNDGYGRWTRAPAALPRIEGQVGRIAFGDVDGDGDPDCLVPTAHTVNFHRPPDRLLLNDGSGNFTASLAPLFTAFRGNSTDANLVDVDGDGDLDAILSNANPSNVPTATAGRIYINNGSGGFADQTLSRMPPSTLGAWSLASGDIDSDGDSDLILSGSPSRAYLNDGTGRFTDATSTAMPTGFPAGTVRLGDADGDGHLDLFASVTNSAAQNRITVLRNDGRGIFREVASFPGAYSSFELLDADDDGDTDVLALAPSMRDLLLNDGNGNLQRAPNALAPDPRVARGMAIADLDGDGDEDVVWAAGLNHDISDVLYTNLTSQIYVDMPIEMGRRLPLRLAAAGSTSDVAVFPFRSSGPDRIRVRGIGVVGLDLANLTPIPARVIPAGAGRSTTNLVIPSDPALVGSRVYLQAIMLDVRTGKTWLSNVFSDVIFR